MKNIIGFVFILISILSLDLQGQSIQNKESTVYDSIYHIKTYPGGNFFGRVLMSNSKIVLIATKDRGEIEIPKYQIEEMKLLRGEDLSDKGMYIPDQVFATRYFISTNSLPIKKGESYSLVSLWGPEVNFGLADNWSAGIMTSWVAFPVVVNTKYTHQLNEKNSIGAGLLAGNTLWYSGMLSASGILPYATVTHGTRKSNINFSMGYGGVWFDGESASAPIFSVAGIAYLTNNVSFVFDSWFMPAVDYTSVYVFIPGLRFQSKDKSAFQFAITGVVANGEALPLPIPFVQWFKKF